MKEKTLVEKQEEKSQLITEIVITVRKLITVRKTLSSTQRYYQTLDTLFLIAIDSSNQTNCVVEPIYGQRRYIESHRTEDSRN